MARGSDAVHERDRLTHFSGRAERLEGGSRLRQGERDREIGASDPGICRVHHHDGEVGDRCRADGLIEAAHVTGARGNPARHRRGGPLGHGEVESPSDVITQVGERVGLSVLIQVNSGRGCAVAVG